MTKPNLKIKTKDSPINKVFINDTSSINQIHLHEIRPSYRSKEQRLNNVECPLKRKKLFENRFDMSLQTGKNKNLTCQMGSKSNACFLPGHSRQHTNEQLFNSEFYENHFNNSLAWTDIC
jgi:hypothetical protein